MYKSLLSILFLAGSALAAPTARQENECVKRSMSVTKWDVEQFDFHSSYIFTTPSHQNSWGYSNFTLSNPAVAYKPICSAHSNQLSDFFYGTVSYRCEVPEGLSALDEASFTYSRPSGALRLDQTWSCPGDDGAWFRAKGGVKLNLTCDEKKWTNPEWKQGQIYSTRTITCNLVDAEAPVEELSAVA